MLPPAWILGVLIAANPPPGDEPDLLGPAVVAVDHLDVFDAPADDAYATATLDRGSAVVAVADVGGGWLAIVPPRGSFDWVDRRMVEVGPDERVAKIIADGVAVRAGRRDARMPGPPRETLPRGAVVALLDLPPLILRQGSGRRSWLAVEPSSDSRRYVRAGEVRLDRRAGDDLDRQGPGPIERPEVETPRIAPGFAAVRPARPDRGLSADLVTTIRGIEVRHRRVLEDPMDRWDLEPIRSDYQSLLDRQSDPGSKEAIGGRLAIVNRHMKASRDARALQELLDRSRGADREIQRIRRGDARDNLDKVEPFDADGVLQASSKQANGRVVWALVDPSGEACYLDMPAAIDLKPLINQRVGVRGAVRYDDTLRARLIRVRDAERIGRPTLRSR